MTPAVENENYDYVRKVIGYYETRQEALEALTLWKIAPEKTDSSITWQQLYDQWTATRAYKSLGKSSKDGYSAAWKHMSAIHKYKVVDVKTPQIQFCVDTAEDEELSFSSLSKIKLLAGRLEKFAMQQDIIDKNYAEFVELPPADEAEKPVFTDLDLKKLTEAAEKHIGVADLILLMCYTGWRIQEFCNLTRFDYDAENQTLTGGLKTDAGKNRVVPVPRKVQPYLKEHAAHGQDHLFCRMAGGQWKPYTVKKLREEFYITLDAVGIKAPEGKKFTPHCTRHTYNTMLHNYGVDDKTRMTLMGQTDLKTNIKTYTHVDIGYLQNAVGVLE